MSNIPIRVSDVHKGFGHGAGYNSVLKGISFEIQEGEFASIMGPSGCGKSTLLYLIGGLDKPDKGTIEVCGKNIARLGDRKKSIMRRQVIGFIFQFYNLVPNLSVEENILLPVIMDGKNVMRYRKYLNSLLDIVALTEKRSAFPAELSGGQQQRVAIARSLIMRPQVLLADEPTGNLDRHSGEEVMRLFQKVNQELGVTVLQVTHSEEIAAHGSRIITLRDGIVESIR